MSIAVSYEQTGRTRQKARTRDTLIESTRGLLAAGASPSVEQVADAAGISRATAYRYFPNQRALLVATYPEIGASSLLPEDAPDDPVERLALVMREFIRRNLETEPELRAALRLSLEPGAGRGEAPILRRGRAVAWIAEALEPLAGRLEDDALRRLPLAIRAACGIEALVWLTDVAGLDRDEAAEMLHASALALLRATLAEHGLTGAEARPKGTASVRD
jgi:AcrR family transcriptional regulator